MLGVEGVVLLLPAFVSLLYREESGFSFLAVSVILGVIFLIFGRKRPASTPDIWKRRICYRSPGMDIVVPVRRAPLCDFGEYPKLY